MTSSTTYRIDTDTLTVIATDEKGESYDLNAGGEPCATTADLAAFVGELCEQGAFDAAQRDALLAQI